MVHGSPLGAQQAFGRAVRERETEMVAGAGQARVDDVADPVAHGRGQGRRVSRHGTWSSSA